MNEVTRVELLKIAAQLVAIAREDGALWRDLMYTAGKPDPSKSEMLHALDHVHHHLLGLFQPVDE